MISIHRVKKLRETLVAVQQLDKNMSSLRSWLVHIETELTKPIIYDSCDFQEIQRKLDLQQVTVHMYIYYHSSQIWNLLFQCNSSTCSRGMHS